MFLREKKDPLSEFNISYLPNEIQKIFSQQPSSLRCEVLCFMNLLFQVKSATNLFSLASKQRITLHKDQKKQKEAYIVHAQLKGEAPLFSLASKQRTTNRSQKLQVLYLLLWELYWF